MDLPGSQMRAVGVGGGGKDRLGLVWGGQGGGEDAPELEQSAE